MTDKPTVRTETQYAIRFDYGDRYRYETHSEYGIRNPPPSVPLTLEQAKKQLRLYNTDRNPTIVSRTVLIVEDPWEEVTE